MAKVALILGAVYHPPSAWDNNQLETYYAQNCKSLVSLFYTTKDLNLTLHFSGYFLDWLSLKHPEYIKVLFDMQKDRRLELLGGAFSAPILPLIPHNDRLGQIEAQTTLMRKTTGRKPRGCWIVRGIWEENLPFVLRSCGIEFSFLPEECFKRIGVDDPLSVFRPCLTESQGKVLTIFPYSSNLSQSAYQGNTDSFWELIDQLERSEKEFQTVSLFLDGSHVANLTGIQKLITEIRDHFDVVETILPSVILKKVAGRLKHHFFATSGYLEMKASGAEFGKSEEERSRSNYKQILSASPGFEQLYAKMIHVNFLAYQVRGDKYRKKAVLDELWLAQDHHHFFSWNDANYLSNELRTYSMKQLITAENLSREKSTFAPFISQRDFDLDGRPEFAYAGNTMNVAVSTKGAQIWDWDIPDKFQNLSWAPTSEKEENRRHSLADYYGPGLELDQFLSGTESHHDRIWNKEFKLVSLDSEKNQLSLSWKGSLQGYGPPQHCRVEKVFQFLENELVVDYTIENLSPLQLRARFGPEWRLNIPALVRDERKSNVQSWEIEVIRGKQGLNLTSEKPGEIFCGRPTGDWGHFYRLLLLWDLDLSHGESFKTQIKMTRQIPKK